MNKTEFANCLVEKYNIPQREAVLYTTFVGESSDNQQEFIRYVEELKPDFSYLWQDTEESSKAHDFYELLLAKVVSIKKHKPFEDIRKVFGI